MQRRTFLVWCVSGAATGSVAGCVPPPRAPRVRAEDSGVAEPTGLADATVESDASVEADAADSADAQADTSAPHASMDEPDAQLVAPDAEPPDAGCSQFVTMHDTHAQALYFDGTYGPLTGVITVDQVLADQELDLEFWHGHNGISHHFLVTRAHFAALKRGERVSIETTEVDSHQHLLFIDPEDESYRASGAPDVQVAIC
jgi:hypothetical protein